MKLKDIEQSHRIGYRHNPKHFKDGSFRIEVANGRVYVVGTPRPSSKQFRVLGVLKPLAG